MLLWYLTKLHSWLVSLNCSPTSMIKEELNLKHLVFHLPYLMTFYIVIYWMYFQAYWPAFIGIGTFKYKGAILRMSHDNLIFMMGIVIHDDMFLYINGYPDHFMSMICYYKFALQWVCLTTIAHRSPPTILMTSSNLNISASLALFVGISPVTGEFPSQRPVTRSLDVFFDLRQNQQLNKRWRRRLFETPSRLWITLNERMLK